jgi:hypothetical protein
MQQQRFQIGDYYLDCPHSDRGGVWYACRYDARTRTTRRRSLKTRDVEQAKIKLAALIAAAPQAANAQAAPGAGEVMTLAALKAYMEGRGSMIASEDAAARAVQLFTDHLEATRSLAAPVAFWTPARQLEFARWCRSEHGHSAPYIARLFNVMRSAFIDATQVKMRPDAVGNLTEAALIASAPRIVMTCERISKELNIAARTPRQPLPSLDQMAKLLDALETEHLFRFAIMALCTWARPQAILDLDPTMQVTWHDGSIDLAPAGWIPTNKRRSRQPISLCLAGWLKRWMYEDAERAALDREAGKPPVETGLLVYKRERVACVKRAFRRIGRELGIEGFSQKKFRPFMNDQARKLFAMVPRENRSRWLGHVVRDGSRTTDHYESDDPHALADVALATDCIISLLAERCERPLFAIETRLNREDLRAIGARLMPKVLEKSRPNGGRDRDRTCDPYHVKVVLFR